MNKNNFKQMELDFDKTLTDEQQKELNFKLNLMLEAADSMLEEAKTKKKYTKQQLEHIQNVKKELMKRLNNE